MTEALDRGFELTVHAAAEIHADWLGELADALTRGSADDLAALFMPDATWRDFMAFPWDFHHTMGRTQTVERLLALAREWDAGAFTANERQPPVPSPDAIDAFFDFTTRDRRDRGYVRLVPDDGRVRASTMQTQVVTLREHPERIRHHRRQGKVYGVVPGRTRWSADRAEQAAFQRSEPAVVVLGAGHNGLSLAARLGALDVPTLVIDREARIGDTWRKRYASLALHSTVWGDHLPYLPSPTWTAHTPKDKLADWLELYATALDLNVWTATTYLNGRYDPATERWTIRVRRQDGSIRELHPRHFVVAGGLFAGPKTPDITGLDSFTGIWAHSDSFQDGAACDGKRVLVVGAGVSGHELAHDVHEHGADVTLLQRSGTYVVTFDAYHEVWNKLFVEDMTYEPEFADHIQYSLPSPLIAPVNRGLVKQAAELDRELLDALQARGFKLEWGPDGTGILGAVLTGRHSYQIDIGASRLIADGRIHLRQGVEIETISGSTVRFTDGSALDDVDLILFATGYHEFWDHIKPSLGAAAAGIDKVYGNAEDGEYANTWRRSSQPGLWFATGFLRMTRFYSQFTAMLIKAIEEGLAPVDPSREAAR